VHFVGLFLVFKNDFGWKKSLFRFRVFWRKIIKFGEQQSNRSIQCLCNYQGYRTPWWWLRL